MAEIALMKSFKLFVTILAYFGGGMAMLDQIFDGVLIESIKPTPVAQEIIMWLFIVMLVLKIVWFGAEKWLQWEERKVGINKLKEEVNDMKEKKEANPQQV